MRTVTLYNGRRVDRRLYWWCVGRVPNKALRLALRLGLKVFTLRPGGVEAGAQVALAQEWMRQAGAPPMKKETT